MSIQEEAKRIEAGVRSFEEEAKRLEEEAKRLEEEAKESVMESQKEIEDKVERKKRELNQEVQVYRKQFRELLSSIPTPWLILGLILAIQELLRDYLNSKGGVIKKLVKLGSFSAVIAVVAFEAKKRFGKTITRPIKTKLLGLQMTSDRETVEGKEEEQYIQIARSKREFRKIREFLTESEGYEVSPLRVVKTKNKDEETRHIVSFEIDDGREDTVGEINMTLDREELINCLGTVDYYDEEGLIAKVDTYVMEGDQVKKETEKPKRQF